jgi:hypothetical protein
MKKITPPELPATRDGSITLGAEGMTRQLFLQNTIACIWDFDKTLIPGYMQQPLFDHFKVDAAAFWKEVAGLPGQYRSSGLKLIAADTAYLNHILTYTRKGVFNHLNNELLRRLGRKLEFYDGLPEFFDQLSAVVKTVPAYQLHDIRVEHYIVSTGLLQMILGSKISAFIDGAWGCEFVESPPPPGYLKHPETGRLDSGPHVISQLAYVLDNTTKTRAIFEINKGSNKLPDIDVNAKIPHEDRRIPFQNMVYVGDGPSDIPVFSLINRYGGHTFAVYQPESKEEFSQVNRLQKQGRVQSFGEADYTKGSQTAMWLQNAVIEIADQISANRDRALGETIGQPPRHLD